MAKIVKQLSSKQQRFYSSLFKKTFPVFVKDYLGGGERTTHQSKDFGNTAPTIQAHPHAE